MSSVFFFISFPDVVLLDVIMPHLDGIGVLEQMQANYPTGTALGDKIAELKGKM